MDAATRERIERGLREWNTPYSTPRTRFEEELRRIDAYYKDVTDAIDASERLSAEDLMLRVD